MQHSSRFRQIRFFWFAISWFQSARNSSDLKIRASFFCYDHQSLRIHSKQNKDFKSLQQALKVQAGRDFYDERPLEAESSNSKEATGLSPKRPRKKKKQQPKLSIDFFKSCSVSVSVTQRRLHSKKVFDAFLTQKLFSVESMIHGLSRFGDKVAFFRYWLDNKQ